MPRSVYDMRDNIRTPIIINLQHRPRVSTHDSFYTSLRNLSRRHRPPMHPDDVTETSTSCRRLLAGLGKRGPQKRRHSTPPRPRSDAPAPPTGAHAPTEISNSNPICHGRGKGCMTGPGPPAERLDHTHTEAKQNTRSCGCVLHPGLHLSRKELHT